MIIRHITKTGKYYNSSLIVSLTAYGESAMSWTPTSSEMQFCASDWAAWLALGGMTNSLTCSYASSSRSCIIYIRKVMRKPG